MKCVVFFKHMFDNNFNTYAFIRFNNVCKIVIIHGFVQPQEIHNHYLMIRNRK